MVNRAKKGIKNTNLNRRNTNSAARNRRLPGKVTGKIHCAPDAFQPMLSQIDVQQNLSDFISVLRDARVHFMLDCVRDAVMIIVPSPTKYYEIEFFFDGNIEVQTFGPAGPVENCRLEDVLKKVLRDVNG